MKKCLFILSLHQVLCQSLLCGGGSTTRRIWCSPFEDISIQIRQVVYTHNEEDWHQWQDMVIATLSEAFQWLQIVFSVNWEVILVFPPFSFFVLFLPFADRKELTEWKRLWPVACSVTKATLQMGMWQGGLSCGPHHRVYHYSWLHVLNEIIDHLQHCYHHLSAYQCS